METELDPLAALPKLRLGALQTSLYAYRLSTQGGIFFVEARDDGKSSGQVNYVTAGIILKAAGEKFRDDEIGQLMALNALENVIEFSAAAIAPRE